MIEDEKFWLYLLSQSGIEILDQNNQRILPLKPEYLNNDPEKS